jgi:cobalt/nickel transport system permease protein
VISTDTYAYRSKLKRIDPQEKIFFSILTTGVCLWANSVIVSISIILLMWINIVYRGCLPGSVFVKFLRIPISFLAIGVLTIAVSSFDSNNNFLFSLHFFGKYIGFTKGGVVTATELFFKSLGAISCMYYLSLNTPMVDILSTLRKLGIPKLFVELMSLIYRFIFVLLDTTDKIFTAQNSRSGYSNLSSGYRSLGILVSKLFIHAYKRSDNLYTALEARGYDGELNVLEEPFEKQRGGYLKSIYINIVLVAFCLLLRFLRKAYFHE